MCVHTLMYLCHWLQLVSNFEMNITKIERYIAIFRGASDLTLTVCSRKSYLVANMRCMICGKICILNSQGGQMCIRNV